MRVNRTGIFVMGLGVCLACILAHAQPPATSRSVSAIPEGADLAQASRQVSELVARHSGHDAASLLKLAGDTTTSPALKYAATVRGIELAATAGKAPLVVKGLDDLAASFEIDRHKSRLDALLRLSRSDVPVAVVTLAMRWTDACYADGRMDLATRFAELVRSHQSGLTEPLAGAVAEYLEDCRFAQSCIHNGTTRPTSGIFECLYQDAWSANLRPLATSGDALAAIASEDLSATDKPSRMRVADAWWSKGSERGGLTGWRLARRAVAIYAQLLPDTTGVERELIAGRLAEHVKRSLRYQGCTPGILREISRGGTRDLKIAVVREIQLPKDDATVDMPRTDPHVSYSGAFLVSVPGPHQLIFTGGSSMRVVIDGAELINNPAFSRKRNGEKCNLDLSAGLHTIEIEAASNSSKPRVTVEWITPGAAEKCLMPPGVLFYDPITQPAERM